MSAARDFQRSIGTDLAEHLNNGVHLDRSRLLLTWTAGGLRKTVQLAGSNKWSPTIHLAFYFGCWYEEAGRWERLVANTRDSHISHVSQYSVNRVRMEGLAYDGPYMWNVDIRTPPSSLVAEIAGAVRALAFPFFEAFSTAQAARNAISEGHTWCMGAHWSQMLYLDAALADLSHFQVWSASLNDLDRQQADSELALLRDIQRQESNNACMDSPRNPR